MINLKAAPCDEAAIRSVSPAANRVARQKPWVLLATILASSITHIDGSVVNIALPAIESNLATSVAVIQWLVNAYTLCLSAFLLTGGVAADRFGRRKMFIIGLILFAAASLWCGFAMSIAQLIRSLRKKLTIGGKSSPISVYHHVICYDYFQLSFSLTDCNILPIFVSSEIGKRELAQFQRVPILRGDCHATKNDDHYRI